ncbi:hypothetical protein [Paenibacillus urinalis]|uniref:hypothetical protein n=1 Tax=Paenibacillus urinalis TaxID=521520 RepID=UPI00308287E9
MFDWIGFKKGLPLWRSYQLNKNLKKDVEEIFEGIAETRMNILISWTEDYWRHLEQLLTQLKSVAGESSLFDNDQMSNRSQLFAQTLRPGNGHN